MKKEKAYKGIYFLLLPVFILCSRFDSKGQNSTMNIDSLKHIIVAGEHDTTVVSAYLEWIKAIPGQNTDSAIILLEKALDICDGGLKKYSDPMIVSNLKDKKALVYVCFGSSNDNLGKTGEAIKYYKKALEIYMSLGKKHETCRTLLCIGSINKKTCNYDSATEYIKKAMQVAEELNDKPYQALCYGILANTYENQNKYDDAISFYNKSLKVFEEMNDLSGIAKCHNSFGSIYSIKKDNLKAIGSFTKALDLYRKAGDKIGESGCYNNIGNSHSSLGNYNKAIEYLEKSLEIAKEQNDTYQFCLCYNNMALVYARQGFFPKAIEYYQKSLKIAEKSNDKNMMSLCYNNIGNIHDEQENFSEATDYFNRSLKIAIEINDKEQQGLCYNNLGLIQLNTGHYDIAEEYFNKSLEIAGEIEGNEIKVLCYNNLGWVYFYRKEYQEALNYYLQTLSLASEQNDKKNISRSYKNIGNTYLEMKNYRLAIDNCSLGLEKAQEIGALEEVQNSCECLSKAYEHTGNSKKALKYYKQFIETRDSLFNEKNTKEITSRELQYEFDKEKLTDSLDHAKQIEIKDLNIRKQEAENSRKEIQIKQERTQKYAFFGGIVLLAALALIIFRSYRQKKMANYLLEEQKQVIEEQNKEILDSITYAKRIQEAILPPEQLVKEKLPGSFILFLPKDIVAGDFYWVENIGDLYLFAVADCTGHGVPGAMVSIVCHNAMNRSVKEFGIYQPELILDKTRELVIETFEKSEEEVKDGMDIALCTLDRKTNQLFFSGANNGLYHVRNGELKEIKADKQPVGKHAEQKPFTGQTLQLMKEDSLYIFSDGFADQFGGPEGKKFKYKPFRDLILSASNRPAEEQKKQITEAFNQWKGELKQVDDVCIIGVKI
ncbi:MAG: DUF3856 domain-containing protein [Bacteroidota bacterium]